MLLNNGSSPHMRGTGEEVTTEIAAIRFIPAHAGNRGGKCGFHFVGPVHPRTCGEQQICDLTILPCPGSSPHMRGTDLVDGNGRELTRFIPAHAGNRLSVDN